jgi:hypothetical protein
MGTRHLTIVKSEGKIFGQYGQWDGYPEGAGTDVLHFAQTQDLEALAQKMKALKFLTGEEVSSRWMACGVVYDDDGEGSATFDMVDKFKVANAHLDRDTGANILYYILNAEAPEVQDKLIFAADSLFCEWAWMLDLDSKRLRCFKGFNKLPLGADDFFYSMKPTEPDYYPVREVQSFGFEELKALTDKQFIAKFIKAENEE